MQRREFDHLGRLTRPGLSVSRVEHDSIPELLSFAASRIPVLSSAVEAVARVLTRNHDSAWVFRSHGRTCGVYAMLHLSRDGLEALLIGEFNTSFPDPSMTVRSNEAPAAIYKWAVVAPGMASAGICAVSRLLQSDRYATANLYARPTTPPGARLMAHLGFRPIRSGYPDLQRYVRLANRGSGLVDIE